MNIVVTAKLADEKLKTKLIGLQNNRAIQKIYLVRQTPLKVTNVINVTPSPYVAQSRLLFEVWRLFQLLYLMSKKENKVAIGIQFFLHGLVVVIAAKLFRKKAIVWLIGSDVMLHGQKKTIKWVFTRTLIMCDVILVMGSKMSSYLSGIPQSKVYEMQSYIDPEVYYPSNSVTKEWDLGFIGNLVDVKNIENLLQAIAINKYRGKKYKTIIVGGGPLSKNLKCLSNELGIEELVQFVGVRKDIGELIKRIRLITLSSKSEGLPAILLESAFCGTPSISSDVGEISEAFRNYNCCKIVGSCTPENYAETIDNILSSSDIEMAMSSSALDFKNEYLKLWGEEGQKNRWATVLNFVSPSI